MFKKWNKRAFKQLEDFNVDRDEDDDKYHEAYMAAMEGRLTSDSKRKSSRGKRKSGKRNKQSEEEKSSTKKKSDLPDDFPWQNTEETTRLWNMIHENDLEGIQNWIDIEPYVVRLRSEDGRGPLWWAYEHKRKDIIRLLLASGADPEAKDAQGIKPRET